MSKKEIARNLHYWHNRAIESEIREEVIIDALFEIIHAGTPEEERKAIRAADNLLSERK